MQHVICRTAVRAAALSLLWLGCSRHKAPPPDEAAQANQIAQADKAAQAHQENRAAEANQPDEIDPGEAQADKPRAALVGTRAPAATLVLLDGTQVALGELLGKKPIYLKFWATWCVPCREQMPHFEATQKKHGGRIALFAVDLGLNDSIEAIRAFQAEHPMSMPIVFDGDGSLAEQFHVAVTPQHILIDRNGVIRHVGHGTTAGLDRAIEALTSDAPAVATAPIAAATPATAAAAPEAPLALTLSDGAAFTLAQHAGAPLALTFVSTWCDWYLAESRPAMSKACIAHTHQAETLRRAHPKLTWIFIANPVWTNAEAVAEFRKNLDVAAPLGIDEATAWFRRFRIRDVPTTILLGPTGAELARVRGAGTDLPKLLERL